MISNNILTKLPSDMIRIISRYIPIDVLQWLSKKNYIQYRHTKIINVNLISKRKYLEKLIRFIIRNDYHFILANLLNKQPQLWKYDKTYNYNNILYPSYLIYIYQSCIKYSSTKCRNLITEDNTIYSAYKKKYKNNHKYT